MSPGPGLENKFCDRPFRRLETLVDGTVTPCCSIWLKERFGDLERQTADELWNGEMARRMRQSIHDGTFELCRKDRCTHLIHGTLPDKDEIEEPFLREVIDQRKVELDYGPDILLLAHDPTCNLSCPSCRTGIVVADDAQKQRFEVIERTVIEPLLETGRHVRLSMSGQGDPWSSSHYRSILKYVAHHDLDLELDIATNGLLMTPARWAEHQGLERYRPSVDVSIDACRPWTYPVVRRNGEFDVLDANLRFLGEKRRAGVLRELHVNATVQLDNYHELGALVEYGRSLGVDGVRLYLIQNTGGHLAMDFPRRSVAAPSHPLHLSFLETLRDPLLADPLCRPYDVDLVRETSFATRLPSDERPFASGAECAEATRELLHRGELERAVALASHGVWRYPEQTEFLVLEAAGLEALGFAQQATYRYREALRRDPADVDAMVALGTLLVESGQTKPGVRQLIDAARACSDPALHDMLADYLVKLTQRPAPAAPVHLPVVVT